MDCNIYYKYILRVIMLTVIALSEDAKSYAWTWFVFRLSGLCP